MCIRDSDTIAFKTAGSEKLRITSGGTVNIGGDYSNTTGKFKVTGQARFDGEIVAESVISVQSGGSINIPDKLIHSGDVDTAIRFPAADTFTVETGGSERLRINSSGRVGINTTTDSMAGVTGNLNIANSNYNNHTVINLSRNTINDRSQIRFSNPNGNVGSIDTFGSDLIISSGNELKFRTNSGERLSITSDGILQVSTNKASGYVAEFNQTHTSNSAQIKINSPTDSNSSPCLIDFARAGTVKWSAGMGLSLIHI